MVTTLCGFYTHGDYIAQCNKLAFTLGRRQELIPPDCAECGFVCKAHPPIHIKGYVSVDVTQQPGAKTSKPVELSFACAIN
jgi:hypothetical protein